MVELVQALVDGVMLGATYSLLGLGFTLTFGVLRRLNLAFGPTILVGLWAGSQLGGTWPAIFPVVAAVTGVTAWTNAALGEKVPANPPLSFHATSWPAPYAPPLTHRPMSWSTPAVAVQRSALPPRNAMPLTAGVNVEDNADASTSVQVVPLLAVS